MLIYPVNTVLPGNISTLTNQGKVAKKLALYPPKRLMEQLGFREGKKVRYDVEDGKLVVELIQDPIDLALSSKKWARASVRELEELSEKEQSALDA
jgi:antitoxin component of MazEF toxin-antitoxin module